MSGETAIQLAPGRDPRRLAGDYLGVYVISGAALVTALFQQPVWSAIAYAVCLVVGSVLMFRGRRAMTTRAQRAGGVGVFGLAPSEKVAMALLMAACLANAVVIAIEVASWSIWLTYSWLSP